jgi:hypothetical protein
MLRYGSLRVSVPRDRRSAVVVGAPRKTNVVVVEGAVSVIATNERVAVANTDGEASLAVGSDPFRPIPLGMVREVDAGAGALRPLAQSPASLDASPVAFSFGGEAALGAFRWPDAAGASSYRLEIRNDSGRLVGHRQTREPTISAGAFSLLPGRYVARVAGIDPSGLEGARPVERFIHVVGVAVPDRGFVDAEGAVHFPPGRSVGISHGEGVEVTYGGAAHFIPAPKTLELMRSETRLVRFRAAGSTAESKLWLVPRQVRASVEFGPSVPTWPKDRLEIRVRVEDSSKGNDASPIEVRPRVLLGVEPVDVAFVRDGDSLRGVLPPQAGDGPWVVRVEVKDQAGTELGRDFVEIARR